MAAPSGNAGITWRELADAVWLAALQADAGVPGTSPENTAHPPAGTSGAGQGEPDPDVRDLGQNARRTPGLTEVYLRDRLSSGDQSQAPAGPAPGPALKAGRPARAAPLPDGRAMSRALRPFKRPVPSSVETELDEDRTAERAVEDNLWFPYTRPARVRRLDLTLVVDEGPSMPAWRRTVAQFTSLLGQLGAFRDVRLRYLDLQSRDDDDSQPPRVILRGPEPGSGVSDPGELLGQPGRRVVLALTDGLGPAWRTGAAQRMLAAWGQAAAVAVIHLFPQQAWHHTGVSPWRVRLRTPEADAPNRRYLMDALGGRRSVLDPLPEDWATTVPVPVLELDKDWLTWWARLVTGQNKDWQDSWVLLAGSATPLPGEPVGLAATGREQVLRFRGNASPTAVLLATYLAAAPLEPGLIEVLQQQVLPESRPGHLAEIWASGLIHPVRDSAASRPARPARLDFIDGAREALLAGAVRADTARAFATAADYYGDRTPATSAMRTALLAPDQAPEPPVTPESLPFVQVEIAVMKSLSGPYLSRARRLGSKVADLDRMMNPKPTPDGTGTHMHDDGIANPDLAAALAASPASAGATTAPDIAAPSVLPSTPTPTGLREIQGFSPPVWNVPPRNVNFTGREDLLDQLHQRLRDASTAAVTPNTLHGMGGVGKSQIAIEYVYRHVGDYEIIWWVPAEQQSQILASLSDLAQSLQLDVGAEANSAVPAVREALRSGRPYKNWLLVFDNAEDIATVRSYFPTGGSGKILVTSRNLEWSGVADTLSVDVFRREESKALLQRRNPDLSDSEADHLAEALGDLPLAIEQAASWHAATGMAVGEYLSLIEQKRLELFDESMSPDYAMSVSAAWNVSLDRLKESNNAALQLLQICAFLAPEPIPRALFRGSRSVELTPELDEVLSDPIKLGRAIRDISRYALARIDYRTNTLQLHRLVQAALVRRMEAESQQEMRHYAHILLANANPNSPRAGEQWPRYQALFPHISASGIVGCDDPWVRELLSGMIRFLYYWGDHEGSRVLGADVTSAWLERFGAEDTETLGLRKFYAFVLRTLGEFHAAAAINDQVATVHRRIADQDDEGLLDTLLQLGADMRGRGEFASARENDQLVLTRAQRAFGDDDPVTLSAAHNLGVSLRLDGDFRAALRLDQDTWQRRTIVLGEDDESTISTLNAVAIDQCEVGEYLGARELQESTYDRAVRLFRVSNPIAIGAARNLAVCRRRAGDIDAARELSEETLTRYQRRYGEAYPDTLGTATNLAVDLRQSGDLAASMALDEQTWERYSALLGERHPYTLIVQANRSITFRLLGEADAAYQLNVVTLAALRERLGDAHPATLACAVNHASDYYALQNFEAALRLDTSTLERYRQVFGVDHPVTLACAFNLALDFRAVGRTQEGDALRSGTLAELRHALGDGHPAMDAAAKGFRADVDSVPWPL